MHLLTWISGLLYNAVLVPMQKNMPENIISNISLCNVATDATYGWEYYYMIGIGRGEMYGIF